jgi:hypothetical protein
VETGLLIPSDKLRNRKLEIHSSDYGVYQDLGGGSARVSVLAQHVLPITNMGVQLAYLLLRVWNAPFQESTNAGSNPRIGTGI